MRENRPTEQLNDNIPEEELKFYQESEELYNTIFPNGITKEAAETPAMSKREMDDEIIKLNNKLMELAKERIAKYGTKL